MKVATMADQTPANAQSFDQRAFRNACGAFATGVTVITTTTEDGPHGMTANAFMSVSLEPPLIAVSVDKKSRLLPKLRLAKRYAVNILTDTMEGIALHFAGIQRRDYDALLHDRDGLPVLPDCAGVFLTDVVNEFEVGDHVLFIGHVTEFDCNPARSPLLFTAGQFRSLPGYRAAAAE